MALQEEMEAYLDDVEEHLSGIESDLEGFFSSVETRENAFSKETDSDAFAAYEWVPRTEINSAQRKARKKYQKWYGAVEPVVYEYLPRRHKKFSENHSKITKYINLKSGVWDTTPENPMGRAIEIINLIDEQRAIVTAAPDRITAKRFNARKEISADIEENEIKRARQLFQNDLIRESGVIAGVALERHLLTMCETSEKGVNYNPDHSIERLSTSQSRLVETAAC